MMNIDELVNPLDMRSHFKEALRQLGAHEKGVRPDGVSFVDVDRKVDRDAGGDGYVRATSSHALKQAFWTLMRDGEIALTNERTIILLTEPKTCP